MKNLMTGNEAIALGVMDSGVRFASAYPGTPSTEILENLSMHKDRLYAEWAPNEKTALESAFGACVAGVRSFASMKHVGLNVAADPFFTISAVGVTRGLVIITADEPGMHSSQNEQDNRRYAYSANIPMLEPCDSQECYDMVRAAYDISEKYDTPVLIRVTTRVCHSKSYVEPREAVKIAEEPYEPKLNKYVAVPANAKVHKDNVLKRAVKLGEFSEETDFNKAEYHSKKTGILASGICRQYAREVFGDEASYFDAAFTHPLPFEKIKQFASNVEKLYVLEENDPIMEEAVKAHGINVCGKDMFPAQGELLPEVIRKAYFGKDLSHVNFDVSTVPPRAPALCAGCPHRGMFYTLSKLKDVYISGDIGCYSLGFAPPYRAMHTTICMGASISGAHGAAKAFELKDEKKRAIAVIGDSTFFHTGINSLINASYNRSNTLTVILDNRITGMTGHQDNPGSGYTASGDETIAIDIETIVRAIGITNVVTIDPNDLNADEEAIKNALAFDGPSVIITKYPCALKKLSTRDKNDFGKVFYKKYYVDEDKCIGCKKCIGGGCPAVSMEGKKARIDENSCLGCGVCAQICPKEAITEREAN